MKVPVRYIRSVDRAQATWKSQGTGKGGEFGGLENGHLIVFPVDILSVGRFGLPVSLLHSDGYQMFVLHSVTAAAVYNTEL